MVKFVVAQTEHLGEEGESDVLGQVLLNSAVPMTQLTNIPKLKALLPSCFKTNP